MESSRVWPTAGSPPWPLPLALTLCSLALPTISTPTFHSWSVPGHLDRAQLPSHAQPHSGMAATSSGSVGGTVTGMGGTRMGTGTTPGDPLDLSNQGRGRAEDAPGIPGFIGTTVHCLFPVFLGTFTENFLSQMHSGVKVWCWNQGCSLLTRLGGQLRNQGSIFLIPKQRQ